MSKMRGIKPELWTDDDLIECSPLARLLFIGMWNFMCDNGHLADKPRQIKLRVLPADACDVDKLLDELVGHDLIERRDGFVKATNLPVHQRIDKRYLALCGFCEHDPQSMFGPGDHMGKKQ